MAAPLGVIGSFLLDRLPGHESCFAFKHHYITGTTDSGVLGALFEAMGENRTVELELYSSDRERVRVYSGVPLKIMISAQSGRQYLMAYAPHRGRIASCRLDSIVSVKPGEKSGDTDKYRAAFERMRAHLWGVSTQGRSGERMEHVEFTVRFRSDEAHIPARLEREKRCGTVEMLGENTARFSADVYDSSELIPWIRTFIRRIVDIHFSNAETEARFRSDLSEMYSLYGIEGAGKGGGTA